MSHWDRLPAEGHGCMNPSCKSSQGSGVLFPLSLQIPLPLLEQDDSGCVTESEGVGSASAVSCAKLCAWQK